MVSFGTKHVVYVNGVPLHYYQSAKIPLPEVFVISINGEAVSSDNIGGVDNFKVWDLDKVEALYPAWVNEFSGPIMNSIKDREPDIQDDFSVLHPDWKFEVTPYYNNHDCPNTGSKILAGRLQTQADSGCRAWSTLNNSELANLVVQVEIDIQKLERAASLDYFSEISYSNNNIFMLYSSGRWVSVNCKGSEGSSCYEAMEGTISIDPSVPVIVTMITYNATNAVYVNKIPVNYFTDDDPGSKWLVSFAVAGEGITENNTVKFDNLKIWDLDKIEGLPEMIN